MRRRDPGGIAARITAHLPRCPATGTQGRAAGQRHGSGGSAPPAPGHTHPLPLPPPGPVPSRPPPPAPAAAAEPPPPRCLAPPPPPPAQAALQAGSRARPARGRSPCCQRSGGAVPSRGSLPPPRSVRVSSPRGEISRVLGRRSAPRSGSNCGPCVRQPSSRRVRGRRTGSSGDTRPDKPARSERRLTRGPL